MPAPRSIAASVIGLRIAYGAALVMSPARLTRTWLGKSGETGPTQVALRGLGARELLLHAGALLALSRGSAVRPWLAASMAGDVTDIVSTHLAREELPDGSPLATLAVAGVSALISGGVAAALDS